MDRVVLWTQSGPREILYETNSGTHLTEELGSIVNRMDQVVHWTQSGPNGILYETDSGIQKNEDGRKTYRKVE